MHIIIFNVPPGEGARIEHNKVYATGSIKTFIFNVPRGINIILYDHLPPEGNTHIIILSVPSHRGAH